MVQVDSISFGFRDVTNTGPAAKGLIPFHRQTKLLPSTPAERKKKTHPRPAEKRESKT